MEVKYLCLEDIFSRWPQRPLALTLASNNLGLKLALAYKATRPALALDSKTLGLGLGLEHAGLEPISAY